MTKTEANHLRRVIEQAAQSLDDGTALTAVNLYPEWSDSAQYAVGFKVRYQGGLYRCLIAHTAQATWMPTVAPSLWVAAE